MRVVNWSWKEADEMVAKETRRRQRKAANFLKDEVRRVCPIGTVSRPMYRRGKFAGQWWTRHDAGALKRSVRVVERDDEKFGFKLAQYGEVRVYVGHKLAWYAQIVEYYRPFMRPAVASTMSRIKNILENG